MKTILAAALFAAIAFSCNGAANAATLSGVHSANGSTLVTAATFHRRGHHKQRHCSVRHGHRHCWWR